MLEVLERKLDILDQRCRDLSHIQEGFVGRLERPEPLQYFISHLKYGTRFARHFETSWDSSNGTRNDNRTFGHQVPFYERSSLGGQNNLRGYGVDRFIDDNLVVLNIEERIHVMRTRIFNVAAEFEIAPFVDMGKVFNTFKKRQLQDYVVTPGIGFRAMVRPSVVGRVDYGYSSEGGAVFAGLDFPF